ncbi:uncharacterized protein BKA78DRAFT_296082 [Phyllosticta capitalensis]|uniref:uncharacterized protein n=1 Tax=Phyllosticta capitalensis TaxID=121624 RepID=UPI0031309583
MEHEHLRHQQHQHPNLNTNLAIVAIVSIVKSLSLLSVLFSLRVAEMPSIRLSLSPGPRPPSPHHDDIIAEPCSPPARAVGNARRPTPQDASLEEIFGLFTQSQETSRFAGQDAEPTKSLLKQRQLQTASKAGKMGPPLSKPVCRQPPVRPPRPSPETLAATQKYLKPTLSQSRYSCSMPVTRPSSQLSESPSKEQEQASSGLEVQSPGRGFFSPRKQMAKKKSVAHLRLSLPERQNPKHMSNSTLDSSLATPNDISKDFSKPTSALSHWVDNSAWPPWSPRSRAASGVAEADITDPSEPPSETPGSTSKARRRLFRTSEVSSQRNSQEPNSSRRNILRSLGMSWENNSSSSESSWSSFGCVDGMRRPDLEEENAVVGENKEPSGQKKDENGKENGRETPAMPSTPMTPLTPGKRSLTRSAGRKMLRKMTG